MINPLHIPRRRPPLAVAGLLLLTAWLGGCAGSPTESVTSATPASALVTPGQALPLTEMTTVDGATIRLDTPGQKKLVVLFATWCSDSQRAMKALNDSPLLNEDIAIVAIAREQQADEVRRWQQQTGYRIPLAVDPDRGIYRRFAHSGIPRFIMIDGQNTVVASVLAEGQEQLSAIRW